jgi:hypothetical protein
MIKQETLTINNKQFIKTYSDENKYILQVETGHKYSEAFDVVPLRYTYQETDEVIKTIEKDK